MLEYFIVLFVVSSVWIVWLRPVHHTLKYGMAKEWLEYWVLLATMVYLEFHVFNELSRQIAYNFVRTMTFFVISERAVAKTTPKKPIKEEKPEEETEVNCDNIAEQLYHIENLSGKTSTKVLDKLLSISDTVPFEIEKSSTWTSVPRTVRGFIAYKIAVLISGDKISQEKLQAFREYNIPSHLLSMITSNDPGERDNSLLALTYIVEKCKKMQKVLFEAHIFDYLQTVLSGTGAATSSAVRIARIIFRGRKQAKEEFMRLKLSFQLIRIIKFGEKNEVVEAAQAANDLAMVDDKVLNRGMLQILANQGLYDAVQAALNNHGADNKVKLQLKCLETLIKSG